jgi:tRNA pseudouridine38-40 synthase
MHESPASRTLKLIVEYDGTDFCGYQSQGRGERTVQSVLQAAIESIVCHPVTLHAAGRTDTGVHALGQVVSLKTTSALPIERVAIAVNSRLPNDLAVAGAHEAGPRFNARFSAVARTYLYVVLQRRTRSAIWGRYSMHVRRELAVPAMRAAAARLIGAHDFAAFARSGGNPGPTTVRRLDRIAIRQSGDRIYFVITANAFLRSMVRNIVGALIDIGTGEIDPDRVAGLLEAGGRAENPCAPAAAHGLCLWRVHYEDGE